MTDQKYLEVSPYQADAGEKIGVDPRKLSKSDLEKLGHPKSYPKIIRAYCLGCCGQEPAEVRKCVHVDCQLWPQRMGRNPFHARAK